jgi:REP element-mobilizing transposase RayT
MTKYKNKFRVESARLKDWDYSIPWWYFVTINTKNHIPFFGKIINSRMLLNDFGKEVAILWQKTAELRQMVDLDYYVIMPNHIHGIIIINGSEVETHRVRLGNDKIYSNYNRVCLVNNQVRLTDDQLDPIEKNISTTRNSALPIINIPPHITSNCLSNIVKGFKSSVTKIAREMGCTDFGWQSRFYDRIIRNEKELFNIRCYIEQNPCRWELDGK